MEERRLDLLALKMGYQSQEERLRAAVLAQVPKINIGFAHASDTTHVITTGFAVTIDLPIFDRNQGHIAIETAPPGKSSSMNMSAASSPPGPTWRGSWPIWLL